MNRSPSSGRFNWDPRFSGTVEAGLARCQNEVDSSAEQVRNVANAIRRWRQQPYLGASLSALDSRRHSVL